MSNGELDLSSISPTEVGRLHGIMDAGSTEIERIADDDVRLCLLALSGTTEVSSCSDGAEARNQTANSRFGSPRFVGSGSFGIVFFVFDNALGIDVAIKLLRPSRNSPVVQKRFLEEARITANLTHPGIIRLFDSGTVGQIPYITSAIVAGGSLADWIAKHPQGMKSEVACRVLLSVAEAVSFAHSKLTYHRDIKPSNILMHSESEDPSDVRPVLTDFGLAKRWDKTEAALTLEGDILGTARYMSPEQASGALDDYSVASEVFSLGIVLYELLTGKVPFDGKSSTEVRKAIIHVRPVSLRQANPELSNDLMAIVQKCLEKPPELRYDSASAFAKDLQRYLLGQPVEASSPSFLRMTIWNAKRHPVVTSSIGLAILTISLSLAAVGYSWWNQVRIAKREYQTKIAYVVLFGKLIDEVVAGNKDQQTAILESLTAFQSNLERDLSINPNDADLKHLLSLVLHYESITLYRSMKTVEALERRVESVLILKELRDRHPKNTKFRFQYLNGIATISQEYDYWEQPFDFQPFEKATGCSNGPELAEYLNAEIDQFLDDFNIPIYVDACNHFRLNVAQLIRNSDISRAEQLVRKTINDSQQLALRHPDELTYRKHAVIGRWKLAIYSAERGLMEQAVSQTIEASACFEEHFRAHFETPWVRVLFYENELWHAELLCQTGRFEQALDLVKQCLPIAQEMWEQDAFRGVAPTSKFRLQSIQYLSYKNLGMSTEADLALENILQVARIASTREQDAATCLSYAARHCLPESVVAILKDHP